MKRMIWIMCVAVGVGFSALPWMARAQDAAPAEAAPKLMTQGELAQLLVKKLGLYRVVAANPSDMECMSVLTANGIFPSASLSMKDGGWNAASEVTVIEVARLLVRALSLQGQVKDPSNDQAWMDVLKEAQVSVETVGAGVSALRPFSEILTAIPLFQITQDPLDKRYIPESDIVNLFGSIRLPPPAPVRPPPPKEEIQKPKPATPT